MKLLIPVGGFFLVIFIIGASNAQINNIDSIMKLSTNLMTDFKGTMKAFFAEVEPFAHRSDINNHLLAPLKALNLALIDIRLTVQQMGEQFESVLEEHFRITGPMMKTPLTGYMDSYIQALFVQYDYVSNVNETINSMVTTTMSSIEMAIFRGRQLLSTLNSCIMTQKGVFSPNYLNQLNACFSYQLTNYQTQVYQFIRHNNKFKKFYPGVVSDLTDCFLPNENLTKIQPVLRASKCLGKVQAERFDEFYDYMVSGLQLMSSLAAHIANMPNTMAQCSEISAENAKEFLKKNNIVCKLALVDLPV